jgi:hypothetical protein
VNGAHDDDPQSNARIGGTLELAIERPHSLKPALSKDAIVRFGANFTIVSIGWQTGVVPQPEEKSEPPRRTMMSTRRKASVRRALRGVLVPITVVLSIGGCGGGAKAPAEQPSASTPVAEAPLPTVESSLPEGLRGIMSAPFTGDSGPPSAT